MWVARAFERIGALPPEMPAVINNVRIGNEAAAIRISGGVLIIVAAPASEKTPM